jgi:hypothetical protein
MSGSAITIVKAGPMEMRRAFGAPWVRKTRTVWCVLSSTGNGLLYLDVYDSEDEVKSSIPAIEHFDVLADLVGMAEHGDGFTIKKPGGALLLGQHHIHSFESPNAPQVGAAWFDAVSTVKLSTHNSGGPARKESLFRIPGRPLERMFHRVVAAPPVQQFAKTIIGSGLEESPGGLLVAPSAIRRHEEMLELMWGERFDKTALEVMFCADAVFQRPNGVEHCGRTSCLDNIVLMRRVIVPPRAAR